VKRQYVLMDLLTLLFLNSDMPQILVNRRFSFKFEVTGPLKHFVRLSLFDGDGRVIGKDFGRLVLELEIGLYQLQIYSNGKIEQQLIRIDKDYTDSWENKGSYSAINGNFLKSSKNYYSERSNHWSTHPTVDANALTTKAQRSQGERGAIFIFFRYPDQDIKEQQRKVAQSMGWRFSLLDNDGRLVYRLKDEHIREDIQQGWMAFHTALKPGVYFLVYYGNKKREMPLYVFPDWQTQLYVMFKRTPIFQTARIQLRRVDSGANVNEVDNLELDALLQNMHNGIYYVPQYLINKTADEKWFNPMLAIVVCYAYLMSDDKNNDALFRIVIRNLREKILKSDHSPDLMAIQLLAAIHFKEEIPYMSLQVPCMLMAGMKAFIRQSVSRNGGVALAGLSEKITESLHNDMVWTSYAPLKQHIDPEDRLSATGRRINRETDIDLISSMAVKDILFGKSIKGLNLPGFNPEPKFNMAKDWISQSIVNQLSLETPQEINRSELALQFQISLSLVTKRLREVQDLLQGNIQRFTREFKIEPDSQQLRVLEDNIDRILDEGRNELPGNAFDGLPVYDPI
jgi:hypothetical protein